MTTRSRTTIENHAKWLGLEEETRVYKNYLERRDNLITIIKDTTVANFTFEQSLLLHRMLNPKFEPSVEEIEEVERILKINAVCIS